MEEHKSERELTCEPDQPCIELENSSYAWGFRVANDQSKSRRQFKRTLTLEEVSSNVLDDISLTLKKGDHMVVVGKIGSGKTSLLYSIMDETVRKGGTHRIRGRIAYVEQEPFILAGSIKDNVCFGLEYAESRFNKAV